jgi:hypothetical protein
MRDTSAVVVDVSPIEGKGCFAARDIRQGEQFLQVDDSRVVDAAHPLLPGEDQRHCDYLAQGKIVLLQVPERHINHCCQPNAIVITVGGERWNIALRDIAPGEEITHDYCINSEGDKLWACNCGAPRCRKKIHSDFFHLPLALQIEYLPYLDRWFIDENRKAYNDLLRRTGNEQTPDNEPGARIAR